jgi:hypothetical protein
MQQQAHDAGLRETFTQIAEEAVQMIRDAFPRVPSLAASV